MRSLRDRVPAISAVLVLCVGVINVASAMTHELPARISLLLEVAPIHEIRIANALALPAGLGLIAAARPLGRRRHRAWQAAMVLLVLLGILNLAKGLDFEEALASWGLAVGLWYGRDAFYVYHYEHSIGHAAWRAAKLIIASFVAAMVLVAIAREHAVGGLDLHQVPRATFDLITATGGPDFTHPFAWIELALGVQGVLTALAAGLFLLAPLHPAALADAVERREAAALVQRHGTDTLSAFKLRQDLTRHWSCDRRAMAAYRSERGALLLAGDPVGPEDAIPGLLDELQRLARSHGLRLACIGASEAFSEQAERIGLKRLYIGDEAMVPTGPMDLSGRKHKSLRKAVNRVARNGYTAELLRVDQLTQRRKDQMVAVSENWLQGASEFGFSMAHDRLVDELLPDALVVLAIDEQDELRGFLHFAPVYGTRMVSLGFMRRDHGTPNGLSDYLVVEAARLLGGCDIEEFSLNFCVAGAYLRDPETNLQRLTAWVMRITDRWFQVESLLFFNAKFHTRWQPRYLLFERWMQLPAVVVAALDAEGQLPMFGREDEADVGELPPVPVGAP